MRKRIKVIHRHVSSNTHINTSLKGRQVRVCRFSCAVTCKHTNTCEGVQDLFYETSCFFCPQFSLGTARCVIKIAWPEGGEKHQALEDRNGEEQTAPHCGQGVTKATVSYWLPKDWAQWAHFTSLFFHRLAERQVGLLLTEYSPPSFGHSNRSV